MGIASVVLGVLAAITMVAGFFLTVVPVAGTVLTFASPVLCLVGLVLGGMAMSEARRDGLPTGLPTAGVAICGITFVPSVVVALTCGLCNACASAGMVTQPPVVDVPAARPAEPADPAEPKPPLPIAPAPLLDPPAPPEEPAGGEERPEGAPPPALPPPPVAPEGAQTGP